MNHRAKGIAWILGLAGLAGCGGDAPPADPGGAGMDAAASQQTAATATTSVSAVALGAATVPVQLHFNMTERPEPGRASSLTLLIAGTEDLDRVEISISSASLDVAPEDASFVLAPLRAGQTAEHPLKITPKSAGLADLELIVKVTSAAGEREARFGVPVLAEAPAPEAPAP
jgi:hypothetical protein